MANYGTNVDLNKGLAQLTNYKGDFGGKGFANYRKTLDAGMQKKVSDYIAGYKANGVQPVGQIEPLNPWQKGALTTANSIAPKTADWSSVKNIFTQALNAANASADPRQNPELMNTINLARDQSIEMRNRLNPTLNANATSAGAFGGTRDAVQRALADESAQKNFDYMQSGLLTDQYNKNLSANLAKASTLSGLGSQGANLFDYALKTALGAGDRVQGQNQTALDAMNKERLSEAGYGQDLLNWYMNILNSLKTNSSTTTGGQSGNALQGALGGGLIGANLFNSFGGGNQVLGTATSGVGSPGGAALPWQSVMR